MLSQTFTQVATVFFVRAKLQLDVYFLDVACHDLYVAAGIFRVLQPSDASVQIGSASSSVFLLLYFSLA
jgi:hypothetical protein